MGIQNYFIQKKVAAALKKASKKAKDEVLSEIATVAIFVDENSVFNETAYIKLRELIKLDEAHFNILAFKEKKSSYNEFRGTVLYQNEINWQGKINSQEVRDFVKKPYDLLIDYTDAEDLSIQLILAQIKAKLKVGYSDKKKQFYNLLIAVSPQEIQLFNDELVRYLKILKLLA